LGGKFQFPEAVIYGFSHMALLAMGCAVLTAINREITFSRGS